MQRRLAVLLALSTVLAGCFGDGDAINSDNDVEASIWESYVMIDEIPAIDPWEFMTIDLNTNQSTLTSWAVFDKNYGGNCCEHYIATSIEGDILNIGGEYPVWSHDRGHEWDTYVPGVFTDPVCRTPVPTNPGQEGLGEGSIVQATNGDYISMSWFPYVGGDGKLDKFYAILYDASEDEWRWCYNRLTEPFYDRSWHFRSQVGVSTSHNTSVMVHQHSLTPLSTGTGTMLNSQANIVKLTRLAHYTV